MSPLAGVFKNLLVNSPFLYSLLNIDLNQHLHLEELKEGTVKKIKLNSDLRDTRGENKILQHIFKKNCAADKEENNQLSIKFYKLNF